MIEVQGVAKYFGRFSALRDLSVTVREGEFVSLFGRNGAGKTTLLRILAGLTRPSSGDVRIHLSGPRSPQEARGGMGYLSHNTALYGDLTAVENLRFYANLFDLALDEPVLGYELADRILVIESGGVAMDVARRSVSLAEFQQRYRALVKERSDAG